MNFNQVTQFILKYNNNRDLRKVNKSNKNTYYHVSIITNNYQTILYDEYFKLSNVFYKNVQYMPLHKVFIPEIYYIEKYTKFIDLNSLKLDLNIILPVCNTKLLLKIIKKFNLDASEYILTYEPQDNLKRLKIIWNLGNNFKNTEDFQTDMHYFLCGLSIKQFEFYKNIVGWIYDETEHPESDGNDIVFSFYRSEWYEDGYKLLNYLVKRNYIENIESLIELCECAYELFNTTTIEEEKYIKWKYKKLLKLCKNYNV